MNLMLQQLNVSNSIIKEISPSIIKEASVTTISKIISPYLWGLFVIFILLSLIFFIKFKKTKAKASKIGLTIFVTLSLLTSLSIIIIFQIPVLNELGYY